MENSEIGGRSVVVMDSVVSRGTAQRPNGTVGGGTMPLLEGFEKEFGSETVADGADTGLARGL